MADLNTSPQGTATAARTYTLTPDTLTAAAFTVFVASVALAIPAVLNGLFQQDLGPSSSQLTWISDAITWQQQPVPVFALDAAHTTTPRRRRRHREHGRTHINERPAADDLHLATAVGHGRSQDAAPILSMPHER